MSNELWERNEENINLHKAIREKVKEFVRELWRDGKISYNWQPGDEELFVRIVWDFCKAKDANEHGHNYPELDASIEAGEELERWKEKCHALEAENEALRSWCKAVEERLKADIDQQKEDMAEIDRLRELLPDAETLRAGDRLGAVVTNTIMTPDDYADLTMVRKWLDKLKGEIGE